MVLVGCAAEPPAPTQTIIRTVTPSPTSPPAVPAPSGFPCRDLRPDETAVLEGAVRPMINRPMRAVDLGSGWAVVSFWHNTLPPEQMALATDGTTFVNLADTWTGVVGDLRFDGARDAYTAAQSCAADLRETKYLPGTTLPMGPDPGTALGPTGIVLQYVPADPKFAPKCRALTANERWQVATILGHDVPTGKPEPRAVDLPEDIAVVAYWRAQGKGSTLEHFVTDGQQFSNIEADWPGSHSFAGIAFADGPKALKAARRCVSG